MAVERDTTRYSSASGSRPLIEMTAPMINKDDPRHQQQRKLVSRRFTPRAVLRHEELVRAVAVELVSAVARKGTAEVVADIAAPLPAMVIGEMLGFDRALWPSASSWLPSWNTRSVIGQTICQVSGPSQGTSPSSPPGYFTRTLKEFWVEWR